ncbi:hypothetical protein [Bdellovibrio sp. HCB2-146]|uniref:hypothetical protein n=1 Tax=Bdellovibrio sp. HCB2-146 TaxID=3394362 RepID=UPI0039BC8A03
MLTRFFLAAVLLLGFTVFAHAGEIHSALDVMTFEDSFVCEQAEARRCPHHSFNEAVVFKAWSAEEKEVVSGYLRNIKGPRLAFLLKTIKSKGITKLHRVVYGSTWYNNAAERRAEFMRSTNSGILWVDPVTNVIGFTDRFFKGTEFIDPFAQIERKQLNVLHELIHVFDIANGHISSEEGFKRASGWAWDGKEFVINGVDYQAAMKDWESTYALIKHHKAADAYHNDRVMGVQYGFPTLYSMTNSHECFAEILSYYILDPTAPTYLSPSLMKYFDQVLKVDASN